MAAVSDRSPIYGRLGSVSLNDIIQLLAMTRRTATLCLNRESERGLVFFRDGQIVHAAARGLDGEEALLQLLEWGEAEFSVEEGVETLPRVSIAVSTEALLLDALRRLDERRSSSPSGARPQAPRRAYPPRPRGRARVRFPWVGAGLGLAATLAAGLLAAGTMLSGAPWEELPERQSPALVTSRSAATMAPTLPLAAVPAPVVTEAPEAPESSAPPPPPAPTTSAPPPDGFLSVVVEPWAFVSIDGAPLGETPLARIPLAPGDHELLLTNPNVVGSIRARVSILSGETLVRRFSFSDVGDLLVLAEPWADVEIDGRAVGQTPLPRIAVPAGPHAVRFRHPELGVRELDGFVRSGETTRVRVDWRTP